jgi:hypothetical protein
VSRLGLLLLLTLFACDRGRAVAVRVSIPGPDSVDAPVAGLGLVALPYDRDSVLRALEGRARTPRPPTEALDTLFRGFREPFAAYTRAAFEAGKLRESLATLKRALDSLPRNAPEYRELYRRFARQSDSLAAIESREKTAQTALAAARGRFVNRSESLRLRVRHWEDSTYEGYDSIVRALVAARHAEPVTDTTGPTGWATVRLRGRGPWWIYARSWDATDPNAEWYWNVPVRGDTVLLDRRTGVRRPKY